MGGRAVNAGDQARNAGPSSPPHAALCYSDTEQLSAAAASYLAKAARADSRILAVATPSVSNVVEDTLPGSVDVEFADADDWFTAPGRAMRRFDEYLSDHEATGRPLAILAEPVWPEHDAVRCRAWHRCEALWALSAPYEAVSMLCLHDVRRLAPSIVSTARRSHPSVAADDVWEPSSDYTDPRKLCEELAAEELPTPGGTPSTIEFGSAELPAVRGFVARNAVLARLVPARVDDVVTAVNEIALNAVVHGGGHGCLRCWRDPWQLVFEVDDHGCGQPDQVAAYIRPRREQLLDSGLGLWIANQLSDVLEVRGGPGWRVRIYILLRPPERPDMGPPAGDPPDRLD